MNLVTAAQLPAVLLGWRPFLDPISIHATWYLYLISLSFFISMVYKAVRLRSLEKYWAGVTMMTVQIVLGMIALAIASYVFVMVYVRFIGERMAGG